MLHCTQRSYILFTEYSLLAHAGYMLVSRPLVRFLDGLVLLSLLGR